MTLRIVDRPSPNHDERPGRVDILVLHYTGMASAEAALDRLTDATAKVSAHYLIDEDGTIYRLVAEHRRAWHCGVSRWHGQRDVNGASVGIELVNPGHAFGYRPFPEPQMAALETLAGGIVARHPIPARNVVGHSDVAPSRKDDPGELFDWARLARAGIGQWPTHRPVSGELGLALGPGAAGPPVAEVQAALAAIGYDIQASGAFDAETESVVRAFQRRFRPRRIDGRADPETVQLVHAVRALAG